MIEPRFKIGDSVWKAGYVLRSERIQCPDCIGVKTWNVTIPPGETFVMPCATCEYGYEGSRGYVDDDLKFFPQVTLLTIGSIKIDTADSENPVQYMCAETGIGSGTNHYESTLFSAKADAETFAADLTAKHIERVRQYNEESRKCKRSNAVSRQRYARKKKEAAGT